MSVSLDLRSSLAACRAEISASGFSPFARVFLAMSWKTSEVPPPLSLTLHRIVPRLLKEFQFLLFLIILVDALAGREEERRGGDRREKEQVWERDTDEYIVGKEINDTGRRVVGRRTHFG